MKEVKRSSRRIGGLEPEFSGLPVKRDVMSKVKARPDFSGQSCYNHLRSKQHETDVISSAEDYSEDDERLITHVHESSHRSQISNVRVEESSIFCHFNIVILCIVLFVLLLYWFPSFGENDVDKPLQELFPAQHSTLWNTVEYGKMTKLPFVLLLVHDKNGKTATCLAKCIARSLVLARVGISVCPILIDGTEASFGSDFLDSLKFKMHESHTLVLLDIDHLPPWTAEKLHYVVDLYTPWISEGVYVLTMEIPNLPAEEKLFTAVTKTLKNKWGDKISADSFDPLVTRVADTVILVQKDVDSCPLCDNFIHFK